ncbi:MAG: HugZ family protein [Candidatus Marinarcus sp.]|uniref:HugZ family pyridoxamine 5'-phosphate oxidase n=1 Tax=Candidatus Marinarcus sp. TaxID=3100987 RepID=UPI003B00874C
MLKDFLKSFKSMVISTLDSNTNPFTSYAPFVYSQEKYYIFISDIAKHSQNLKAHKELSIFFIEDEQECENIFARKRVVLECSSTLIDKKSDTHNAILNQFEATHGKTVKMLRKMSDFNLFELSVKKGEAVFGFGKAYDITNDLTLIPRDSKGHK